MVPVRTTFMTKAVSSATGLSTSLEAAIQKETMKVNTVLQDEVLV